MSKTDQKQNAVPPTETPLADEVRETGSGATADGVEALMTKSSSPKPESESERVDAQKSTAAQPATNAKNTTPATTPVEFPQVPPPETKTAASVGDSPVKHAETTAPLPPPQPAAAAPERPGRAVAVLALVVALAALGWGGWSHMRLEAAQQRLEETKAELVQLRHATAATTTLQTTLRQEWQKEAALLRQEWQNEVAALQRALVAQQQQSTALAEQQAQWRERLALWEAEMARVKAATDAAVRLTEAMARQNELKRFVEVRDLVTFAEQRLRWAHDPSAARDALQRADATLSETAQPWGLALRQAIAHDLATLQAVSVPDVAGLIAELTAVQRLLAQAPLAFEVPVGSEHAVAATNDDAAPWYQRLWNGVVRFGEALGQSWGEWLRLERLDAPMPATLSPAQRLSLQAALEAHFASARLAALQGNAALYRGSIEEITAFVTRYYEPNAEGVQAVQQRLAALKEREVAPNLPTLEQTLAALAQLQGAFATAR